MIEAQQRDTGELTNFLEHPRDHFESRCSRCNGASIIAEANP